MIVNLAKVTSFKSKNTAKLIDKAHLLGVLKNPKLTTADKIIIVHNEALKSLSNMSVIDKIKLAIISAFKKIK